MAGNVILAGATLTAGEGQGQLSQCYGAADTSTTTVVAAAATNLSSVYTIPAGEAYVGAAYELSCGGNGTWGSTQQVLTLAMALNGTSFGSGGAGKVAAAALPISAAFFWSARYTLVCVDGVSSWNCTLDATVAEQANNANPGTASTNTIPLTVTLNHTATVASAITVAVQALWGSTTGAPTLTNSRTNFRKIA
jgi:hypothetical protein